MIASHILFTEISKSNNILLDENFEAHVGDFELAKVIDMPQSKSMSAVAGSYGYIAPGKMRLLFQMEPLRRWQGGPAAA